MTAPIVEIFSSIQGEGLLVGERQVFLRFAGCNLCCAYCDTPGAQQVPPTARIEMPCSLPLAERGEARGRAVPAAAPQDFDQIPNPLSSAEIAEAIRRLLRPQPGLHHSVALTGGEPLLHAAFLAELLPMVGDLGARAYLETNGTLADELVTIIEHLDFICADIKLPSSTKQAPLWESHERFLFALAANEDPSRLDFWKCVVTADCDPAEVERAARLIASVNPELPLVLQPATRPAGKPATPLRHPTSPRLRATRGCGGQAPTRPEITPPLPQQMLDLQAIAKQHLPTVRIIPQMHRLVGFP